MRLHEKLWAILAREFIRYHGTRRKILESTISAGEEFLEMTLCANDEQNLRQVALTILQTSSFDCFQFFIDCLNTNGMKVE